jgi:hypothetical protein
MQMHGLCILLSSITISQKKTWCCVIRHNNSEASAMYSTFQHDEFAKTNVLCSSSQHMC